MKAYSEDLRRKIVDALKRGTANNEAATLFGVSLSSVKRFARMERDGVSLAPKSNHITRRLLEADLADRPAATASKRRRYLERMTGEPMSDSTLRRLVFVDEMGSNTSLHELYAYSPRGERAYCSVARNRGKNTTLLSSMSLCGMGPSMVVEGGADGAVFEGYLGEMLVPTLGEGDVMVMDNLSAHKGEGVRDLIESAGAEVLYLPPYSPEFNPIEEAFSKIKNLVRKAGARVREALGEALCEVTEEDARSFFDHCGYREAVQLL